MGEVLLRVRLVPLDEREHAALRLERAEEVAHERRVPLDAVRRQLVVVIVPANGGEEFLLLVARPHVGLQQRVLGEVDRRGHRRAPDALRRRRAPRVQKDAEVDPRGAQHAVHVGEVALVHERRAARHAPVAHGHAVRPDAAGPARGRLELQPLQRSLGAVALGARVLLPPPRGEGDERNRRNRAAAFRAFCGGRAGHDGDAHGGESDDGRRSEEQKSRKDQQRVGVQRGAQRVAARHGDAIYVRAAVTSVGQRASERLDRHLGAVQRVWKVCAVPVDQRR